MPNRLASETSPYLLQHADNPVDWYPWGEAAFAEAHRRDKPVLLSVGYSSCHWCHVMAHESFEDSETAALMNQLCVNVKVDREERPDVDAIYMNAVQAMTGRGGWPMTVWLTPDAEPFYAGTYFPRDDRPGLPSFTRVLRGLDEAWVHRRADLVAQAARITEAINRSIPADDGAVTRDDLANAVRTIVSRADNEFGGIGGAPKFPQEPVLELLLRASDLDLSPHAQSVAFNALDAMAAGGLWDHIGGGFYRYAVDATWTIPHFEKMLYTNAQLARLYLRAWQQGAPDSFRDVARATLDYLLRDLSAGDGFGSAEDADSDGVEGKFYVFSKADFDAVVGDDADVAGRFFGISEFGNFEGQNHLRQSMSLEDAAGESGAEVGAAREAVHRARIKLFEHRTSRVRPGLDDKVITAWNALAIRALAEVGSILQEPRFVEAAERAAHFIRRNLVVDGVLQRSFARGKTSGAGFLDDHAGLAVALFTLYQATGNHEWYTWAVEIVGEIESRFMDGNELFSTPADGEPLITRPKDQMDNPLPSGSSLAAEAFLMRSLYAGQDFTRFEAVVNESGSMLRHYPTAAAHLLGLVASRELGYREVAVTGPEAVEFARPFWASFRHNAVLAIDATGDGATAVPLLADRWSDAATRGFVCEGFVCQQPALSSAGLAEQLDQATG